MRVLRMACSRFIRVWVAVLALPAFKLPCSRNGRGCAGKKLARQAGQLLLARSQVTIHDEPIVWPHGRATSHSTTPVEVLSVMKSSRQIMQFAPLSELCMRFSVVLRRRSRNSRDMARSSREGLVS